MKHLVFDVETTNLDHEIGFIVSIGAVLFDDVSLEEKKFYRLLNWFSIYPTFTTKQTEHIHGISDEEIKRDGIYPTEAFSELYDFIIDNGDADVMVAFNLSYDQNMFMSNLLNVTNLTPLNYDHYDKAVLLLEKVFKKDFVDELEEYKGNYANERIFFDPMIFDRLFNFEFDGIKSEKRGLEAVGLRYEFGESENAHNALADSERTLEIYKKQLAQLKEEGVEINQHLEVRMIKQYKRNQIRYASKKKYNQVDYLGANMVAAKFI